MKKLNLNEMVAIEAGTRRQEIVAGCAALGLAAGIAAGLNPLVGGLTTLGCILIA
jgi:L-cysteine desulfidase